MQNIIAEKQQLFEGIETFIAVGKAQSFVGAARTLGVSTSHVSRTIAQLEAQLGVRLVARTTRRVSLTDTGIEYFQRCTEIADGMEAANQAVASHSTTLRGRLRISAAGDFAERLVLPKLLEFAKQHPELLVDIDFNTRNINLVDEGIDFAIRYGELKDSSLVARKLAERNLIAAASPEYLEQFGTPTHPAQLGSHRCLIANFSNWRFMIDGEVQNIKANESFRANNAGAIVKACEAGMGIAYLPHSSYDDAIQKGRLQSILTDFQYNGIPTWLVYPDRRFVSLRAKKAMQYLLDAFADWR